VWKLTVQRDRSHYSILPDLTLAMPTATQTLGNNRSIIKAWNEGTSVYSGPSVNNGGGRSNKILGRTTQVIFPVEIQIRGYELPTYISYSFTCILWHFYTEHPHAHIQWHGMRDSLESNGLRNTRKSHSVARAWFTRPEDIKRMALLKHRMFHPWNNTRCKTWIPWKSVAGLLHS
jgi:hypothetical protein